MPGCRKTHGKTRSIGPLDSTLPGGRHGTVFKKLHNSQFVTGYCLAFTIAKTNWFSKINQLCK